ncbi:hypothetical protein NG791_28645 [Laspinema sp. D1]|uniref:hypothetical protein n=1 Tax=Laspinema palackyanum TaxID=3231601 RepID=UPI00349214B3|nr:hypothetical protein [Laspinema sp. D2b]
MSLFQLTNWRKQLSSSDLGYQLVYRPGKIGENQLFGYVVDFQVYADLPSLLEVAIPDSQPLDSEVTQAEQFYNLYKFYPFKKLGIYSSSEEGIFYRHFGVYLFNRRPYYYVDLLPSLTKAASLQVGLDGLTKNPISWFIRIEEESPEAMNTGGLAAQDKVSVLISANEESPKFEVKPIIFSLPLIPGSQNILPIPEGLISYSFKVRGNEGDIIAPVRFAWQSGLVAVGGGYTLEANSEESEAGVFLMDKRLYFATDVEGVTIIFKGWV